jgi:hypothetical protein
MAEFIRAALEVFRRTGCFGPTLPGQRVADLSWRTTVISAAASRFATLVAAAADLGGQAATLCSVIIEPARLLAFLTRRTGPTLVESVERLNADVPGAAALAIAAGLILVAARVLARRRETVMGWRLARGVTPIRAAALAGRAADAIATERRLAADGAAAAANLPLVAAEMLAAGVTTGLQGRILSQTHVDALAADTDGIRRAAPVAAASAGRATRVIAADLIWRATEEGARYAAEVSSRASEARPQTLRAELR